jgi:hypothetical protein
MLISIRSTSHRPLPQHLFKRLLETQRNLQHLEILPSGAVDDHYGPDTRDSRKAIAGYLECAILEKLDSIRVIPDRPQTAALCSIALHKSNPSTAHCLEVDARHWADAADFQHAQGMATKDQLVESLFAHLPRASPGHNGPFDNLTILVLRDVKLDASKYTWFTYLSLSKLQRLELSHCKGADIFLLQLTSGPDVPALKSFTTVHDVGEHTHDRSVLAIKIRAAASRHWQWYRGPGAVLAQRAETTVGQLNCPSRRQSSPTYFEHRISLRFVAHHFGTTCLRRRRVPRPLGVVRATQTAGNRSTRSRSRVQHPLRQISRILPLHHKHGKVLQFESSQPARSPHRLRINSINRLLRRQRRGPGSSGHRNLRYPPLALHLTPGHCFRHS